MLEMPVRVAVEGDHDAELARRVLQFVGLRHEEPIVAGGKGNLDKLLRGYNNAARFAPWLILRDLDEDASCAASLRDLKLPSPAEHMRFRVVVHAAEAWLLADEERICSFLKVDPGQVPGRPEDVRKPKIKLAELGGEVEERRHQGRHGAQHRPQGRPRL